MDIQTIAAEGNSLSETRTRLKSLIPGGYLLKSEDIVTDEKPVIVSRHTIRAKAGSLEAAKRQAIQQIPDGFEVLNETVISEGGDHLASATAALEDEAIAHARSAIPLNATIIDTSVIIPSKSESLFVDAYGEESANAIARIEARTQYGRNAVIHDIGIQKKGSSGFLGIGKRPDRYQVNVVVQCATVEVSYKTDFELIIETGKKIWPDHKWFISATIEKSISAESIITRLRQNRISEPVCWVVCYEDRPLQGIPPHSDRTDQPYLMIFTSLGNSEEFTAARRKMFFTGSPFKPEPEPLSIVGVDTLSTLKELAMAGSGDSRYAPPPCGLLLNFTYPAGITLKTVSPDSLTALNPEQLDRLLFGAKQSPQKDRCMICERELIYQRNADGQVILQRSRMQEQAAMIAYKCRRCNAPICMGCAPKHRCSKCGGNVFDPV